MFEKLTWPKATTVQNINVNVPRKSMKAIVLLFKDDNSDSESLKTIKISTESKPNQVYPRELTANRLYEEAHRLFSNKIKYDENLSVFDFFKDGFSVIDLRSNEDNMVHKSGKMVMNTQSSILLELTESAVTAKDQSIYVFVVSDGLMNFINNDFQRVFNTNYVVCYMKTPFNFLVGMTASGKTKYLLDTLENDYKNHLDYIVLICPTFDFNKTYHEWKYKNDEDFIVIQCDQDHVDTILKHFSDIYKGKNWLIILDDCTSSQQVKNRVSELVRLAFSY